MRKIILAVAASWLLILSSTAHAFDVIQLTDNSADDFHSNISGSNVVWEYDDPPAGRPEVYLWDGATTTKIGTGYYPDIDSSNMVWHAWDGSDYEIYFWDGASTTQVTNNSTDERYPAIFSANVVWQGCDGGTGNYCDGGDYEIYFWDGMTTTQITNNATEDLAPVISGSNVVWEGCDGDDCYDYDGDFEIYLWDGLSTTQITNNDIDDRVPAVSSSNVAWIGCDGFSGDNCWFGHWQIYFWNGATTTQITNNSWNDWNPDIDGSNVVWHRDDPGGPEIYLWNGSSITQITDSSHTDYHPTISGSNVVWTGNDGSVENDFEIYMTTIPEPADSDSDGVPDVDDNCPVVANGPLLPEGGAENQLDADEDGIGDACECGDFDGDGLVNTIDARLIQRCSVGEIPCAPVCDTTGEGDCNTIDARLVQRFAVGELTKVDLHCSVKGGPVSLSAAACGLGFEAALVLPPLVWVGGRLRRRRR